jgi:hypothetical protein
MTDDDTTVSTPTWWHKPLRTVGIVTVSVIVVWTVFWFIFRGTASILATVVGSSMGLKVLFAGLTGTAIAAYLRRAQLTHREEQNEKKNQPRNGYGIFGPDKWARTQRINRGTGRVAGIGIAAAVIAGLLFSVVGSYTRGQTLAESSTTVDGELPSYSWRTPWDVASDAVTQRATIDRGNFAAGDTTYLPASRSYSTPVTGRGFGAGFTKIVIQKEGTTDTQVCDFSTEAPRPGGFMASNLRRQIALIDSTLVVNHDDVWGYCDGDEARLVAPVTRMVGNLERHPVPAGVVIFDGADGTLRANVEAGELPGPVYPMSLAAAQRTALASTGSLTDKVFNRAGYELSEGSYDTGKGGDGDGNSAELNNSEFLLGHSDGDGYDFVTPLTSRSNSERITAVSTISADHVEAGKLNELVVHRLGDASQRGNVDQVEAIRANFPDLGWETGIAVAEIIPTGDGVWEASLRNGGVVAKRVRITGETLCVLTADGDELDCTSIDSDDAAANEDVKDQDDTTSNEPTDTGGTDIETMTDEELVELIERSAAELRKRQSN